MPLGSTLAVLNAARSHCKPWGRTARPWLTNRQREAVAMLADGLHYKEINDKLGIKWAGMTISQARRRAGCRSVYQLVAMYMERKMRGQL